MLEITEREEHVVLYPSGYLNGTTGKELVDASEQLSRQGWNHILIHFGRIETINTMGIAGLVSVLERVPRRGGEVYFCELGATNREMLDVLSISSAVLIFDNEQEAVNHWKKVHKTKTPSV